MSGPPPLRRRWFIGGVAFTMSMWRSGAPAVPRSESACERMRKKLISLLHEPERARKVGAVYLRSPPGRLNPPTGLAETMLAEMGPNAGDEAIRRDIVARIRRELQDVQVISLDGWIMSLTEARLCGLVAADGMPPFRSRRDGRRARHADLPHIP
jgi:hypothetical protein